MKLKRWFFLEGEGGDGSGSGGGGAPAGGSGEPAGGTGKPAPGDGTPAGGTGEPGGGQGSGGSALGAGDDGTFEIPEKFAVKNEDGTIDYHKTAMKIARSESELKQRMGAGEAPPKEAKDYKVTVPDALKDVWKPNEDNLFLDFQAQALEHGLSQKQFDFMMGKYFEIAPNLVQADLEATAAECKADLEKDWKTPEEYGKQIRAAYLGAKELGGDALIDRYKNDPVAIRMFAKVAGMLKIGEDTSFSSEQIQGMAGDIEALQKSDAYKDPKHPEHAKVSKQIREYYEQKTAAEQRGGKVPVM